MDTISAILSICSLITSIGAVITVVVTFTKKVATAAKAPVDKVHERIDKLTRITLRSLLALMDNAINGDNIDGLKEARDKLQDYLINED